MLQLSQARDRIPADQSCQRIAALLLDFIAAPGLSGIFDTVLATEAVNQGMVSLPQRACVRAIVITRSSGQKGGQPFETPVAACCKLAFKPSTFGSSAPTQMQPTQMQSCT